MPKFVSESVSEVAAPAAKQEKKQESKQEGKQKGEEERKQAEGRQPERKQPLPESPAKPSSPKPAPQPAAKQAGQPTPQRPTQPITQPTAAQERSSAKPVAERQSRPPMSSHQVAKPPEAAQKYQPYGPPQGTRQLPTTTRPLREGTLARPYPPRGGGGGPSRPPREGQRRGPPFDQAQRPGGSSRPPFRPSGPNGDRGGPRSYESRPYESRSPGSRPPGSRSYDSRPPGPRGPGGPPGARSFGPPRPGSGRPPVRPGGPAGRFAGSAPKEGTPRRAGETKVKVGEDRAKQKLREVQAPKALRRQDGRDDVRARHGYVEDKEEGAWRARKRKAFREHVVQEVQRPSKIKVRLPISIKDLAQEMKLKASELIGKLFIQGMILTLNSELDDATTVQVLGTEFGCDVVIDTAEEDRVAISHQSVKQEIQADESSELSLRPPVVAFMGHVDHGKTSLIDAIRKSNRAAKEVGAITQHIGAFSCQTEHGNITILDTPGHEAFSLMRERGAGVTDIVVLVIAGDEGIQEQTLEAMRQAREAQSTIVVAITKSDKPAFNAENVYRQLAEHELLPEVWGGQTVAVHCSAVTGEGVTTLLEMLALQAEVLELKASPAKRARGTVIESEMQQGLGATATVLVQNGTLKEGDSLVCGAEWARVKSMRDENGKKVLSTGPGVCVRIVGLSGLPEAGDEFIVVKNEKEAKEIAEVRREGKRRQVFQTKKRASMESFKEGAVAAPKKEFALILRADVQGSLEALAKALEKIQSNKVSLNIIAKEVGQISESDIQLAATSGAAILGFHTSVEAHAETMIKALGVKIYLSEIIYHAVDEVRLRMLDLLEKLPKEEERGKAEVRVTFKASQLGVIAGCQVIEGSIVRNMHIRVRRGSEVVWTGAIASLKRVKDDVREVQKGVECGILLQGYNDVQVGDILEAFEIVYIAQEL